MIHKAYRYRIYPVNEQREKIERTLGAVRYVYNHFLREWNNAYHEVGRGLNFAYCSAQLPKLKKEKETAWLKEVDSTALQVAVRQLADAFIFFYKYQTRFPQPKSKNAYYQRFVSKQNKNNIIVKDEYIRLPKIGWIKAAKSQGIEGRITSVTVTKELTGRYYLSLMTRFEQRARLPLSNVVAVVPTPDGGFFTSDGKYYKNDFMTKAFLTKLKNAEAYQYRLQKSALESDKPLHKAKNYQKQVKKVARMYDALEKHREDFLHKMTSELVKEYGVICLPRVCKKDWLPKALYDPRGDASWEELVHKLNYKCQWAGRVFFTPTLENRERNLPFDELAEVLCLRAIDDVESV